MDSFSTARSSLGSEHLWPSLQQLGQAPVRLIVIGMRGPVSLVVASRARAGAYESHDFADKQMTTPHQHCGGVTGLCLTGIAKLPCEIIANREVPPSGRVAGGPQEI